MTLHFTLDRSSPVRIGRLFILMVALSVGPPGPSLADAARQVPGPGDVEPPKPADRSFSDVIDVRVVEIEVVVTGKDGKRLHGLEAGDFRLLIDGRDVDIEYFDEVRDPRARGESALRSDGDLGFEEATIAETPVRRSYLVFVDDYFTDRGRRERLLGNLVREVQALQAGEQMAVVRFAGETLEVFSDWTASKDRLTRALEQVRRQVPSELLRRGQFSGGLDSGFDSNVLSRQIHQVTKAMAAAMRSLADAEGRKLLVPITGGWNFDPSLRIRSPVEGASAQSSTFGSERSTIPVDLLRVAETSAYLNERLLDPVTDAANLFGYTIYPMHVGRPGNVEWASQWAIARRTGGRIATEGAANTSPLTPVRADTVSYYVLGFTPDWEWDDGRHGVEVEVDLPGTRVRHRKSFRDLSRAAQRAQRVEQAFLVDGTEGGLEVRLGEPTKIRPAVIELPIEVEIPLRWVTKLPSEKGWKAELELRIATQDQRGRRSEMLVIPVELGGPGPAPGGHSVYEARMRIREVKQRLVVSLTDSPSGEARIAAVDYSPESGP